MIISVMSTVARHIAANTTSHSECMAYRAAKDRTAPPVQSRLSRSPDPFPSIIYPTAPPTITSEKCPHWTPDSVERASLTLNLIQSRRQRWQSERRGRGGGCCDTGSILRPLSLGLSMGAAQSWWLGGRPDTVGRSGGSVRRGTGDGGGVHSSCRSRVVRPSLPGRRRQRKRRNRTGK